MAALDKIALSVIVFFVFIIGGVLFVNDVEDSYEDEDIDMELDQYINDTYTDATGNDSYDEAKSMQDRMFGKEVDEEDTESSMFSGSFSVIRLITTPARLINSVMNQVADKLEIPAVFVQYGFAALIISMIFGVIYLIFRVKGGA